MQVSVARETVVAARRGADLAVDPRQDGPTPSARMAEKLLRTLPARDQRALIEQLSASTPGVSSYGHLSLTQRAELDEALGEAELGETIPADESFDDLAQRYGFADA